MISPILSFVSLIGRPVRPAVERVLVQTRLVAQTVALLTLSSPVWGWLTLGADILDAARVPLQIVSWPPFVILALWEASRDFERQRTSKRLAWDRSSALQRVQL